MDESVKKQIADDIVKCAGGLDNFTFCGPCTTRVRFMTKDESKVDMGKLKKIPNTMGCVNLFGQYQVIVGYGVNAEIAEIINKMISEK